MALYLRSNIGCWHVRNYMQVVHPVELVHLGTYMDIEPPVPVLYEQVKLLQTALLLMEQEPFDGNV
jgi:hypothetical protein